MGAGGWGSLLCHHGWVPMGREGGSSGPTPYGVSSTPTLRHLPHSHTPCARCLLILAGHRGHPGVQDPGQRHRQPLCAGRPRHATAAGGTGRESAGCWRPGWCWVPLPRPWQGWPGGYCPSHPHPTPARRPLNQCLPPSILHPTPPPPPPHGSGRGAPSTGTARQARVRGWWTAESVLDIPTPTQPASVHDKPHPSPS